MISFGLRGKLGSIDGGDIITNVRETRGDLPASVDVVTKKLPTTSI